VFIVVSVYFVIDSVWKLLDTPSYDSREMITLLKMDYEVKLVVYLNKNYNVKMYRGREVTFHALDWLRMQICTKGMSCLCLRRYELYQNIYLILVTNYVHLWQNVQYVKHLNIYISRMKFRLL
jgi:hypothetical protein